MLQSIINLYKKFQNKPIENSITFNNPTYEYSDFENGELFNQVLNKCIQEHTDITGVAGTGKSNFITILTNKLYKEKRTYIMCANAISELNSHFQKHLITDNILLFCLKSHKSHTIDINYLFSLDSFLNFICISNIEKDIVIKNNYSTWFNFFDDEENSKLLKEGYYYKLRELIKIGLIDDYGDLNKDSCKRTNSVYLTLQDKAYYYNISEEDKNQYIFFLNILQLSLNQKETINVLFDEGKIFFDGYRNSYIKSLNIEGIKSNFIFCSQLLEDVFKDTQIICFKGHMHNNFKNDYLDEDIRHLQLDILDLKPGCFYLFDKQMNKFAKNPIKVPFIDEKIEIQWHLFLNNKQTKMHKQLQLDLIVNDKPTEKKLKI